MDENSKTYEYHEEKDGAGLKKYTNGKKVTEYDEKGNISKYTYDGKEIQAGSEDYKPDAVTAATGKYSSLRRSQSNGNVDFQGLGEGIYKLEEVGIPEGYQSANKQFKWIFKVEKTDDGLKIVSGKRLALVEQLMSSRKKLSSSCSRPQLNLIKTHLKLQ